MSDSGFDGARPIDKGREQVPVTTGTKQRFSTSIERRARTGSFLPAVGDGSFDFYHRKFSSDLNNIPADITTWWFPQGTNRTPNLRGTVAVETADNLGVVKYYELKEIPDGWDIEVHEGLSKKKVSFEEMMDAVRTDGGETLLKAEGDTNRRLEESKQLARELGIAGVYEQDIQDLITVLDAEGPEIQ